jgi:hypothetical protein
MLITAVKNNPHIQLRINLPENDMMDLIANAQINVLPSFQQTGIKLKLLNALFNGRFCIGTPQLTEGTGLDELCITVENEQQMIEQINKCLSMDFTSEMVEARKQKLNENYSNRSSVSKLADLI